MMKAYSKMKMMTSETIEMPAMIFINLQINSLQSIP